VRLAVLHEVLRELMIEGQSSCTEDSECPSGRTCDLDKLLCR
jgi:Cys-rich repeat protein